MDKNNDKKEEMTRELDGVWLNKSKLSHPMYYNLKYLIAGILLGIVFVKAEVISWYRIQEMFRFQSFHMYGIIGSAVLVGMVSIFIIKKFNIKTIHGEKIEFSVKKFNKGQVIGGLLFGAGWAMTGACPGPIYVLIGAQVPVFIIVLLSAIAGTYVYGVIREKLPH
ncbi:MAG TPA: DUF6691 family protein [Cytophagaceae bacterium]